MFLRIFAVAAVLASAWPSRAQADPDLTSSNVPAGSIWLDSLDLSKVDQDYSHAFARRSITGRPLTLGGVVYAHGVGTHANGAIQIQLDGSATHFDAMVGVDADSGKAGSVTFTVYVDTKKVVDTAVIRGGQAPVSISVDLTGAKWLRLETGDAGDGITFDHSDWAGALITLAAGAQIRPRIVDADLGAHTLPDPPRMVIPADDPRLAIHGPRIVGASPGRPFLFLVPATGKKPITYSANRLPAGLTLDPHTGIISGALKSAGSTLVNLRVRNGLGSASRDLTIVGGAGKLALTPPMGWNSWYTYGEGVNDADMRASADALVSTGLVEHGYQYVNIDDAWEGRRDSSGNIQSNIKFPDMIALADYIHAKGLKFGIYSSPGPKTCGNAEGSFNHEDRDALTYAGWGVDFLKYDFCSYSAIFEKTGRSLAALQNPYAVMRASLDKAPRDIVYSFCQYGMGDVWKWGAQTGGNMWRTNGDLRDRWISLKSTYEAENGHEQYAGPGHWNDPDMLSVGVFMYNWLSSKPSHLTPNEQILQFTVWSLIAAPLIIGGDVTRLDKFTLGLLSNDEVIDIDQDPLGKAAGKLAGTSAVEVWPRPLSDGSYAVGLINPTDQAAPGEVTWTELGLTGRQPVRDLWLHKDLGLQADRYSVSVPPHGAVLIKVGTPKAERKS